jgi:hypothetical protein
LPSTEQRKLAPPSLEAKAKVGVRSFVDRVGPPVIVTSGAGGSTGGSGGGGSVGGSGVATVNDRVCVAELPAASVARTRNV